jgi:hypothetical protein
MAEAFGVSQANGQVQEWRPGEKKNAKDDEPKNG